MRTLKLNPGGTTALKNNRVPGSKLCLLTRFSATHKLWASVCLSTCFTLVSLCWATLLFHTILSSSLSDSSFLLILYFPWASLHFGQLFISDIYPFSYSYPYLLLSFQITGCRSGHSVQTRSTVIAVQENTAVAVSAHIKVYRSCTFKSQNWK